MKHNDTEFGAPRRIERLAPVICTVGVKNDEVGPTEFVSSGGRRVQVPMKSHEVTITLTITSVNHNKNPRVAGESAGNRCPEFARETPGFDRWEVEHGKEKSFT